MWDEDEFDTDSFFEEIDSNFKLDGITNKEWDGNLIVKSYNPDTFTTTTRKIDTSDYIKSFTGVEDITKWLDDNMPSLEQPLMDYEKLTSDTVMSQVDITDDFLRRNLYCRTTRPLIADPLLVGDETNRVNAELGKKITGGNVVQTTGTSTTNVMSQKAVTDAIGYHLSPKEDIRNIEDIRLDLIEICKAKEIKEYETLVYVGNGYWKPCKDRIWDINYRIEIMISRGYDIYPYNLIDDRGDMLKDKSSLRRLKNIKTTLQQKRNDIECKYKKLVERIDNSETKTELYLIEREL